jgi:hypothetical protein
LFPLFLRELTVNLARVTNSLLVSAVNTALIAITFVFLIFPRFTKWAQLLAWLIVILAAIDVVLVLRDLWRSGTRLRAVGAIVLWLPLFFLISMVDVWEGPLYASTSGNPPHFEIRGAASFCGLEVYGPEQDDAEWSGDNIGSVWEIEHSTTHHFPVNVDFTYGDVPSYFVQRFPSPSVLPSRLDSTVTYKVVIERCMGGPQTFSLRGFALTEYKANPNVCWGALKVSERQNPAWVRVDCQTKQTLPMSERAKQRLEEYRKSQIPFY